MTSSTTMHWLAALVPVALISAATVLSKSDGTLPGITGGIPATTARGGTSGSDSCGKCHSDDPGEQGVATSFLPGQRSLDLSQTVSVTVQVSGGPQTFQEGGFAAENDAGTFSAGPNTQVDSSGAFVSHTDDLSRSWSFSYTAPAQPGVVQMFAVAMAADGDDSKSDGDEWALHAYDPTSTAGTPVHLYANQVGVQNLGSGCVGPYGNWPVLGAKESPTSPNASFALELYGGPGAAAVSLIIGLPSAVPLPLDAIGVQGCSQNVFPAPIILALGVTSGTPGSQMGDGQATLPLAIPPGLSPGTLFAVQAALLHLTDPVPGRSLPVTLTNGLVVTTT